MVNRTLYIGNPAYLHTADEQLVADLKETGERKAVPIEDIGVLILDNAQITVTHVLLAKLLANNAAVITCNETHHPTGLLLNLDGHTLQSQKFKAQVDASVPLKKQLWQQTVAAKINNQAALLAHHNQPNKLLLHLAETVKSGDTGNNEAKAAVFYWKHLFSHQPDFIRIPEGPPPNNMLNYGYAVLRALVARALVGAGLLPTLGIFHRNQYNAYCLADDVMEPYRPFVDAAVWDIAAQDGNPALLDKDVKRKLLQIPTMDVRLDGAKSPLMTAVQRTAASLAKTFDGSARKILYPTFA